ncbi:MAG: hypothetical protein WDK95_12930 [Syntrophorhabdaceae bacterium]
MITEKLQVLTPTKEEYKEVVQCMLDNGNVWMSGKKDVLEEYWDSCKENTTVEIGYFKNGKITYNCPQISGHTAYTTKEFLDKYDKKEEEIKINIMAPYTNTEYYFLSSQDLANPIMQTQKDYKLDNKTMNIKKFVKTLTLSKEDKLLREYGLQNDCGDFTEEVKELVINKLVEDNKAYLVEIATKLKEEDKE